MVLIDSLPDESLQADVHMKVQVDPRAVLNTTTSPDRKPNASLAVQAAEQSLLLSVRAIDPLSVCINVLNTDAKVREMEAALKRPLKILPMTTATTPRINRQATSDEDINNLRAEIALLRNQQAFINQVLSEIRVESAAIEFSLRTGDQVFDAIAQVIVGVVGSAEDLRGTKNTIEIGDIRATADSQAFVGRGNFDINAFFKQK